jgi:hypothetical protein
MQLVTLSIRPDVFAGSWAHVRHFMPWVDRAVVVTPQQLAGSFAGLPSVEVVTDEELTGRTAAELAALDHQSRNSAIRRALAAHPAVDDVFLMADDDSRPMKPVDLSLFVDEQGRHRLFYFYELTAWPGRSTPFDEGQHVAAEVLGYLGCERRAYAAHQPQIVRKSHMAEAWKTIERLTDSTLICEWASYGNIARHLHPEDFCEPEPYRTLCWPMFPGEWPFWVRPAEYVFENFYEDLYRDGGLFAGLPTTLDPERVERSSVEKILRWSSFGRRVATLDIPEDVTNPWIKGSPVRRVAFRVLRVLNKAYQYVAIDQRSRLSELSGEVDRRPGPRG